MSKSIFWLAAYVIIGLFIVACTEKQPPHSNPWLEQIVQDWQSPDPEIRRDTRIRMLWEGHFHVDERDVGSLEFFHQQALNGEPAERETAAAVLGLIRNEKSLPILRSLTDDPSEFVRSATLRALWEYGIANVEEEVLNGLDDESNLVRREAANLLTGRRFQYSAAMQSKIENILDSRIKTLVAEEPVVADIVDSSNEVFLKDTGTSPLELALAEALKNQSSLIDIAVGDYEPGSIEAAIIEGDLTLLQEYIERRNTSPNALVGQSTMGLQHSLLMLAALTPHEEVVKYLIDKGADVNYESSGFTPLLRAVTARQLPIVAVLATRGANLDYVDETGRSALLGALADPEDGILEYLLHEGVAVNNPHHFFSSSWTLPLVKAAELYSAESVSLLLSYGADVNAVDSRGHDALYYGIKRLSIFSNCCSEQIKKIHEEEFAVIKALVQGGASVQDAHLELLDDQYRPALADDKLSPVYKPYYEELQRILSHDRG